MKYYLIDSHTHPQFPQYDKNREEVIRRSLDKGIGMICVGTDWGMSQKAVELAHKYDGIYASIGLHPNDDEEFDYEKYLELAKDDKVVAIGETGLDYYRTKGEENLKKQKEKFEVQIKLAREVGLPLIIHCRDAYEDTFSILSQEKGVRGVMHSFLSSVKNAEKFLDLGFYLGFNGIITFARDYDKVITSTPLEKILIETDAPFLAPEPYRGKRNESLYVEHVCEKLATLLNIDKKIVATRTVDNSKRLFGV
jgi:TatD DNase family protein